MSRSSVPCPSCGAPGTGKLPIVCPNCNTPFNGIKFKGIRSMIMSGCKNNKTRSAKTTCYGCYKEVEFFLDDKGAIRAVPPEKPLIHPLIHPSILIGIHPDIL